MPALADGIYTVQAEQEDSVKKFLVEATFTAEEARPVTLTSPANGSSTSSSSQTVEGAAGTEEGDLPTVAVHLYAGPTTTGTPLQTVAAQSAKGSWSATFGGLSPGTYTAQAEQSDDVGNVGHSQPVTFTFTPPPGAAPAAQPLAAAGVVPVGPVGAAPGRTGDADLDVDRHEQPDHGLRVGAVRNECSPRANRRSPPASPQREHTSSNCG